MRRFNYLIISLVSLMALVSCRQTPNCNAIWLWGSHMKDAPVEEYADKGYGHILLNEAAFKRWGEAEVYDFVEKCEKAGITVHIWFQCFHNEEKWISPIDDERKAIRQDYYEELIARASDYVRKGIEGIHLDYIRFGGTASKHDFPEVGVYATDAVTEFCRQANVALKAINPDVILSAALMPEKDSEAYYGQNPQAMGQYLDILMPMIYRYGYNGEDKSDEWVVDMSNWFEANSGSAEVWVGIQTYGKELEDGGAVPLTEEQIYSDCRLVRQSNATGLVLFRHGLGTFPDLNGFWEE